MSKIEWTDKTQNPITVKPSYGEKNGWHYCIKISTGCKHCFAERMNKRLGNGLPYNKIPKGYPEMTLNVDMLQGWSKIRKSKKIFVGSMTDIFGEWVPDWMIFALLDAMTRAQKQTFQILTKRPERMSQTIDAWLNGIKALPPNILVGISAEDQTTFCQRLPHLVKVPGSHFLSLEPLLNPINLGNNLSGIHWVIIGGESGPGARPLELEWIEDILEQCEVNGIPAFVKQLGSHWAKLAGADHSKGGDPNEWPEHLRVRMLPGEAWSE